MSIGFFLLDQIWNIWILTKRSTLLPNTKRNKCTNSRSLNTDFDILFSTIFDKNRLFCRFYFFWRKKKSNPKRSTSIPFTDACVWLKILMNYIKSLSELSYLIYWLQISFIHNIALEIFLFTHFPFLFVYWWTKMILSEIMNQFDFVKLKSSSQCELTVFKLQVRVWITIYGISCWNAFLFSMNTHLCFLIKKMVNKRNWRSLKFT